MRHRASPWECDTASMNSLEKILLPSSRASRCEGPTSRIPRHSNLFRMPATSGTSGPTTVRSGFRRFRQRHQGVHVVDVYRHAFDDVCASRVDPQSRHCPERTRSFRPRAIAAAARPARVRARHFRSQEFSQ